MLRIEPSPCGLVSPPSGFNPSRFRPFRPARSAHHSFALELASGGVRGGVQGRSPHSAKREQERVPATSEAALDATGGRPQPSGKGQGKIHLPALCHPARDREALPTTLGRAAPCLSAPALCFASVSEFRGRETQEPGVCRLHIQLLKWGGELWIQCIYIMLVSLVAGVYNVSTL